MPTDGGAVQEPIEHRGSDGGITESCCPVSDSDVRGEDRAALQVTLVDHLEQGRGAVAGQRQIAQFVDHEQLGSGEEPHAGRPAALDRGLVTPRGEVGGGGEVDPVAGLGGAAGEGGSEHCLADSGRADEQDVGGVVEEPHGGQVADELLVDAGLRGEVEVRERPGIREAGEPQPAG